jgi:hypothetical protein
MIEIGSGSGSGPVTPFGGNGNRGVGHNGGYVNGERRVDMQRGSPDPFSFPNDLRLMLGGVAIGVGATLICVSVRPKNADPIEQAPAATFVAGAIPLMIGLLAAVPLLIFRALIRRGGHT